MAPMGAATLQIRGDPGVNLPGARLIFYSASCFAQTKICCKPKGGVAPAFAQSKTPPADLCRGRGVICRVQLKKSNA